MTAPTSTAAPTGSRQPSSGSKTKVLWIWHAAVVAEYQKPLRELASCDKLDVTLLVPMRWPERSGQMVRAEELPGRNFRVIKAHALFTGFYYVYFFPLLLFHLLRLRPDIIYCYEEPHAFISALVLFLRPLFLPRTRVLLYAAQNIKKRYPLPFRLFEGYCFRRTDAILACGEQVAAALRSKGYRGDLRVVPLPVDTAAFSPDSALRTLFRARLALPDSAFLIGYAGKLVEEKGLRTLWAAFEALSAEHPHLHLLLAGGGPLFTELREAARKAGLEARLHTPGVVHNSDLPGYLNACDTFVLPSETRPNWREQFGRAIVEAMSCGVPVVGSDSGEIAHVVGDAGLIFHEGDARALAACLRRLVTEPDLRATLSLWARDQAESLYSTEKVAAQHMRIYEQFAPRNRG